MQIKYKNWKQPIIIDAQGQNAIVLEEIISKFTENNIQVFLLITPANKIVLERIPENQRDAFSSVTQKISERHNVTLINLQENYSDLNIWNDWRHIGFNPESAVYWEDIGRSLITELRS